ncbi:MAG: DNA/RNA non-specific endonuclease [Bacteroidetes bacterium]|nr:DNA/RNA non-specific endonuclease [Bacteroidota bacterium]
MIRYSIFYFLFFVASFSFGQTQDHSGISPEDLELPAIHPKDIIVKHAGFTLCYNESFEQAAWVAYELTAEETNRVVERSNRFVPDPNVPTGTADNSDYAGSGYDRGHLAPAADMGWSAQTMQESFYFSNMSPQVPSFNRGIWKKGEELVRDWANLYGSLYVVTGPVLEKGLQVIGPNRVAVPEYYYKIILDYHSQHPKMLAWLMPNQASDESLQFYVVSADSVETLTGIDFFPALPDSVEEKLEAMKKINLWEWQTAASKTKKKNVSESNDLPGASEVSHAVQCKGVTNKGTRCMRKTKHPSGRCAMHQ